MGNSAQGQNELRRRSELTPPPSQQQQQVSPPQQPNRNISIPPNEGVRGASSFSAVGQPPNRNTPPPKEVVMGRGSFSGTPQPAPPPRQNKFISELGVNNDRGFSSVPQQPNRVPPPLPKQQRNPPPTQRRNTFDRGFY